MEQQKSIMLTVVNVHKKGWGYAPWWVALGCFLFFHA